MVTCGYSEDIMAVNTMTSGNIPLQQMNGLGSKVLPVLTSLVLLEYKVCLILQTFLKPVLNVLRRGQTITISYGYSVDIRDTGTTCGVTTFQPMNGRG